MLLIYNDIVNLKNQIMDSADQIKNHIAKGEPDKAIKLLLEYTKEHRPKSHDEALLLSGQYRQWKREVTLGVEHSSNELRRIEMCVMEVLNDKETYEEDLSKINKLASSSDRVSPNPTTKKSNLTFILLGVFGTISVAFILMLLIAPDDPVLVEKNVEEIPQKTVFGGGLTEEQFDQSLTNYRENTEALEPARFDINMVIQVRYTTGEREGFFESISGTDEWIERGSDLDDIKARYKEVDRKNRTITLKDIDRDRRRFIAIDEDKIYEQVETFQKMHIFNIIGVY